MHAFEREIGEVIVDCLALPEPLGTDFDPQANLFETLGLDSIDALEIVMALKRRYGVDFAAEDDRNQHIFANIRTLAAHVEAHRPAPVSDARAEMLAKISTAFVEMFELEEGKVTEDAHLVDDLELDSIDALDMMAKLQEFVGRRVPESKIAEIRTVREVVDLCIQMQSEGATAS